MRGYYRYLALATLVVAVACEDTFLVGGDVSTPANLTYALEPSGDPDQPRGLLLAWNDVPDGDLDSYRVYSRGSSSGGFHLRGETTSPTFHDAGVPHLQYYVTAVDVAGHESAPSTVVTVDERLRLERPATLASISLNGAIHLKWADNAFLNAPARFRAYRVYATGYDLDAGLCDTQWLLEGTTVAPEFLVGALANGVPRCFGISAESVEGFESLWSPLWQDTPRPDARNVLVFAYDENVALSGFRYWQDVNADGVAQAPELGLVVDGNRTDIDFWLFRDPADSSLWIVPEFGGTSVRLYAATPIADLSDIDVAPAGGYSRNMLEAVPGYGYVFEIVDGPALRYGGLRVTHVGRDYLIFDWSLQTDVGNPQLLRHGNVASVTATGHSVPGSP
jgi:hypothetical protein